MIQPNKVHFENNKATWNHLTQVHLTSDFYDHKNFLNHRMSLKAPELELLGDLSGKSILHLQCHFGQDTLSFLTRGAKKVTGVDLSDEAIREAKRMTTEWQVNADFHAANVYDLEQLNLETYDLVFTSYGTIIWLPDLTEWAQLIAQRLNKGGQFCIVDFHPLCYCYDWEDLKIKYDYFNQKDNPDIELVKDSYTSDPLSEPLKEVSWNHSTAELLAALRNAGLSVDDYREWEYSPYNCFPNFVDRGNGEYVSAGLKTSFPYIYGLLATKR